MHFSPIKLISAFSLALALLSTAVADEPSRKPSSQPSLLERYTSATQEVILEGLRLVGVRYQLGGTSENGLDCSGFVQKVFQNSVGAYLPRTAREQSEVGTQVDINQLKAGDLVFFNTMRRTFSHVGIYLGDNHFLHAPRSGAEVRIENMDNSYWMSRYNGARRILDGE